MDAAVRYWAFLSYSHADRLEAERLHRSLESYRIPSRLVGQLGPAGAVPPRLHPVFRDRDELTASERIGPVVESALASSRAMIVLCSPAAAESSWVDAEIVEFQRLQPQAPVLCVLLAGEPMASAGPDTAAQECLPPSLRMRFGSGKSLADLAPVAVDLRPQGDGWRMGVQKLVAGLAGVPLGQLVQRDAHRRHQRMAVLSAMLALVAIGVGALAFVAARARDEAQAQRIQAEGLVEFMLGDLRKKLEPVGRLDALDAVGSRALQYYDSQNPRTLDADALGRRSRALHLIGEISDRRGDIDGARAAFYRARDTTAELLRRAPGDGQRVYEHSQSVGWVGYIDWQRGDSVAAEKAQREYLRLAQRLHEIDPKNQAWFTELGNAHSNIGTMFKEQGRTAEAIAQYELARGVFQQLVDAAPKDATHLIALGQAWSWLSSSYVDALRLEDGLRAREREIAIYAPLLAREPRNAIAMERMMIARRFKAQLLADRGELAAAETEVREAVRMSEARLQQEPDDTVWQKAAAKSHLLMAEVLRQQRDPLQGMVELERARVLVAGLRARDDSVWAWSVELPESLAQVESDLQHALGNSDEALQVAKDSTERLRRTMQDPKQRDKTRRWLALAVARTAALLDDAGEHASAQAAWREASALLEASDRLDVDAMRWQMRAHLALGNASDAVRIRKRLQQASYRHPDLAEGGARTDGR